MGERSATSEPVNGMLGEGEPPQRRKGATRPQNMKYFAYPRRWARKYLWGFRGSARYDISNYLVVTNGKIYKGAAFKISEEN